MNKFYEQLDYYTDDLRRDKELKKDILINRYKGRETERRGKELLDVQSNYIRPLTRAW